MPILKRARLIDLILGSATHSISSEYALLALLMRRARHGSGNRRACHGDVICFRTRSRGFGYRRPRIVYRLFVGNFPGRGFICLIDSFLLLDFFRSQRCLAVAAKGQVGHKRI